MLIKSQSTDLLHEIHVICRKNMSTNNNYVGEEHFLLKIFNGDYSLFTIFKS